MSVSNNIVSSNLNPFGWTESELRAAAAKYPFSLPIQANAGLFLKDTDKLNYNKSLKISAVISPDRNWLYNFLNPSVVQPTTKLKIETTLVPEPIVVEVEPETEPVVYTIDKTEANYTIEEVAFIEPSIVPLSTDDLVITEALNEIEQEKIEVVQSKVHSEEKLIEQDSFIHDIPIEISSVKNDLLEREILKEAIDKTIQKEVGEFKQEPSLEQIELNTENPESSDFNFWLNPSKNREESRAEKLRKIDTLIEKFIHSEPRIVPKKAEFFSPSTSAKQSVSFDENLVSEPLATIFERQGYFDKAIKAYEKLSLKYPEKRTYFAARIEKIQEIIKNIKNNK